MGFLFQGEKTASDALDLDGNFLAKDTERAVKNTSHHDIHNFHYYHLPNEKELNLGKLITKRYVDMNAMYLCEHVPAIHRFFFDVDAKTVKDFDITECIKRINGVLLTEVKVPDPEEAEIKKYLPPEYHDLFRVSVEKLDFLLSIILKSDYPGGSSFHVIWPFFFVSKAKSDQLFNSIKKNVCQEYTNYLEIPLTLRAPFCDKWEQEENTPSNRPFRYFKCLERKGRTLQYERNFQEFYPFGAFHGLEGGYDFNLAVFSLASLRFPLYLSLPPISDDLIREEDGSVSATNWFKDPTFFDPKDLENKLNEATFARYEDMETLVVRYMNRRIALLLNQNPTVILTKYKPAKREDGRVEIAFLTKMTAANQFGVPMIAIKEQGQKKRKTYTPFKVWMEATARRTVSQTIFSPNPAVEIDSSVLNLWTGLRFSWSECTEYKNYSKGEFTIRTFMGFVYNVICDQDKDVMYYFIHWCAFIVMKPWKATLVAPILDGQEGIGKSLFFRIFSSIFGKHAMSTSKIDNAIGKFNAILFGKILIVFEEFNKLDSKESALLRALITEPMKTLEKKGIDSITVEQPVNIAITTNNLTSSIMNIGPNARRWLMLKCRSFPNNLNVQSYELMAEWAGIEPPGNFEGVKCFMHFLSTVDLSDYDPRVIPPTKMLMEQKIASMPALHLFIYEALSRGFISSKLINIQWHREVILEIEANVFDNSYLTWCTERKQTYLPKSRYLPLVNDLFDGQLTSRINDEDHNGYLIFPHLDHAKVLFRKYYKDISFGSGVIGLTAILNHPPRWNHLYDGDHEDPPSP